MEQPQVGQIISLNIHGLGSRGEGVGYYNGYAVFVDGALPGETIDARLTQCQKRYGWAELLKITNPSPDRIEPPCKLFGKCGGCQLMHLSYEKQLEIKRQRVVDALERIGKIDDCEVAPCLSSPSSLGYRNKIQLPTKKTSEGMALGLYARSSHDLIEVDKCHIHCPLGEEIYRKAKEIVKSIGKLRHLLIKSAIHTGEALVILVTDQLDPHLSDIAKEIMARCPAVKGVVHNLHQGPENVILGKNYKILAGAGFIHEKICGFTFKVSPASFFQINPKQAEHLYAKALEFADLKGNETVLDAYCGVGTLALLFAKHAKKVIGVECVPEAIEDARENAKLNHIGNATFACATSEGFIDSLSGIDLVLLNPPRKGCELSFLRGIQKLSPKRLVYVSCDPATLARDLSILREYGYKIDAIQPFDMFPQTAHVECVAKLTCSLPINTDRIKG